MPRLRLSDRSHLDTDKLFPFSPHQVSMAFKRAVRRAGIEDFRLHDARHSFASWLAMSGVPTRGLQELLGHADPRMTARYTHLSDAHLRAAVDGLRIGSGEQEGTHLAPADVTDEKAEWPQGGPTDQHLKRVLSAVPSRWPGFFRFLLYLRGRR